MSGNTSLRKRHADFRNWYEMPCCGVNVGVVDDAVRVTCPACGAVLCQLTETISVVRDAPAPNDQAHTRG